MCVFLLVKFFKTPRCNDLCDPVSTYQYRPAATSLLNVVGVSKKV